MIKLFLTRLLQLYFRYFPLRKGKIPVLRWLGKSGISSGIIQKTRFDKDLVIEANLDDWIQKQIYFFGRYEIEKNQTKFWKKYLRAGMIVLDIGANIGYYSLMAAKRVKGTGLVYSFEPVTDTFIKLNKNIHLNQFQNIKVINKAMSDTTGIIEIFTADVENTGTASFSEHTHFSGVREKVETITGDDFFLDEETKRLDLVKIDVEGAEMKVLKGMIKTLRKFKPLVLVEINKALLEKNGTRPYEIYQTLGSVGYEPYEINQKGDLFYLSEIQEGNLIAFLYHDNK